MIRCDLPTSALGYIYICVCISGCLYLGRVLVEVECFLDISNTGAQLVERRLIEVSLPD